MSDEARFHQSLLGDVVAFTALPAVWVGQPPHEVARALADALDRTLFPDAVAIVLRTEQGIVDVRVGDVPLIEADVRAYHAGGPLSSETLRVDVGPLGRRGAILVRPGSAPRERFLLVRLAANLADTAVREAALAHQASTARAQLTKLEKLSALGQLVSGVAHELRTPLTYANNSLHLAQARVRRAKLPPEERVGIEAMLTEVLSAHDRIAHTVSTLRRLSAPRASPRSEVVLTEAVAEAARLFALTHVGSVAITRRLEGTALVRADAVEIQQAVLNLLQNAAEAAPHGVRIVVATRDVGDAARLIVEDDGPGIPPESRGRLFDPFFTTKPSGMGLGLSIVRRIVESHGGVIDVGESAAGGARFEMSFPRARPAPVDVGLDAPLDVTSSSGR